MCVNPNVHIFLNILERRVTYSFLKANVSIIIYVVFMTLSQTFGVQRPIVYFANTESFS